MVQTTSPVNNQQTPITERNNQCDLINAIYYTSTVFQKYYQVA